MALEAMQRTWQRKINTSFYNAKVEKILKKTNSNCKLKCRPNGRYVGFVVTRFLIKLGQV